MGNTLSNSKIAIITAITGSKDQLLTAPRFDNVETILFTDKDPGDIDTKGWQIYRLPLFSNLSRSDRRNAKLPKILPFIFLNGYDFVVWQDGGHRCAVDPHQLIEKYLISQDKDIAAFMHGRAFAGMPHTCIYNEAENIKRIKFLEDPKIIDEQVAAYQTDGFPGGYGLSCNAAMLWRQTEKVWRLQLTWWEQICRYSSRDQMSFFYSLWKTNMKDRFTYIDGHWERNNEIPRIQGHIKAEH